MEIYTFGQDFIQLTGTKEIVEQIKNLENIEIEKWFEEGEIENIGGPDLYSQLSEEFKTQFYYDIRNYISSLEF